ncbi:twin-arginine translocation signal domain-containing protein [Edaphobacter aggregans]|uniref:twin-arginine translocation signal domain-containing protein n=1 Tax=Edaphobacter aggregans TaxID=570835 RepID=UPI000551907F|nr:twin-arginine translocation signal domain-containing protein [Edaphobacter aggregans]
MTSRRTFLTAGGAVGLVAALPSPIQATPSTELPKKSTSILFDTITTMSLNTLKELATPGPQRATVDTAEIHTNLAHLFSQFEASGVNEKINAYLKAKGGFTKARARNTAPYSTKDLEGIVEQLKSHGVPLSANDVHAVNVMLNSPAPLNGIAAAIDKHGISCTQRALVLGTHPKAEARWALYKNGVDQMKQDPSATKMFVSEAEGFQDPPPFDPTNWWWWTDWGWWNEVTHPRQAFPEEEAQVDPSGGFWWPSVDDPTNYTTYTEDFLAANVANFVAQNGQPSYQWCTVILSLSALTIREFFTYLREDPELLAYIALLMGIAPEAVLFLGVVMAAMLIIIAGYCAYAR